MMKGFIGVVVSLLVLATPLAAQQPKKKLYIERFDSGAPQAWWTETGLGDVGNGIQALLIQELVKDGTFEIVENPVLADAIVKGSLTRFGFEEERSRFGGLAGAAGLGAAILGAPLGPSVAVAGVASAADVGTKEGKAQVNLTSRVVNPEKESVVETMAGEGKSKKKGLLLGGVSQVQVASDGFGNTILGEATKIAVADLAEKIVKANKKITVRNIKITGKVADVSGTQIVLNVGSEHGVVVGDELVVQNILREIKDPDTGEVLRKETQDLGIIRIEQVDAKSSTATVLSGTGFAVGNLATKK